MPEASSLALGRCSSAYAGGACGKSANICIRCFGDKGDVEDITEGSLHFSRSSIMGLNRAAGIFSPWVLALVLPHRANKTWLL